MIRFLEAVFILTGMIIGVGMFAIPFSFAAAGFWLGTAELVVLAAVVLAMHLLYSEIVLATPSFHRMPGYIRTHLGYGAALFSWVSTLFGIAGTLLAYVAAGAIFLHNIFVSIAPGADIFFWAALLTLAVALITFFPLRKEAHFNGFLAFFEIAFIAGLALFLLPKISLSHLAGVHPENMFIPYGVLLFALSGGSVVPDMITIIGRRRVRVRTAIVAGSLIPALLYSFFALAVVGVTGSATSSEAITGLRPLVGADIVWWGSVVGLLAVFTSFIALSANFQALLHLDMKTPRILAWLVASAAPILLYLAGFQNFIAIIGSVGAVAFGIDATLVIAAYNRMKKKSGMRPVSRIFHLLEALIIVMVIAGVIYEVTSVVF